MNVGGLISSLNPVRVAIVERIQRRVAEIEQARLGVIERLEVAQREVEEAGQHEALDARAAFEALTAHFQGLGVDLGHAASDLTLAILEASEKSIGDLDKRLARERTRNAAKRHQECGQPLRLCQRSDIMESPVPDTSTNLESGLRKGCVRVTPYRTEAEERAFVRDVVSVSSCTPRGHAVGMLHQFRCVEVLSQRPAEAGSPPG